MYLRACNDSVGHNRDGQSGYGITLTDAGSLWSGAL